MISRLYKLKEVASMIGLSYSTIDRAVKSGKLKAIRPNGATGDRYVTEQAVDDFLHGGAEQETK